MTTGLTRMFAYLLSAGVLLSAVSAPAATASAPKKENSAFRKEAATALRKRAEKFLAEHLAKKPADFGRKRAEETNAAFRLTVGDLFRDKQIRAVVFFLPRKDKKDAGAAMFEQTDRTGGEAAGKKNAAGRWRLRNIWPLSEKGLAALRKIKGAKAFALRNLSSDHAPEIILADGERNGNLTYTALRYVRRDNTVHVVAENICDPYWEPRRKLVTAFEFRGGDDNIVTNYRWVSGRLRPYRRCEQRVRGEKRARELVLVFRRYDHKRWRLSRRCIGNLPFYANPVGKEIMLPLQETGKLRAYLSTPEKSYVLSGWVGVVRIASFKMSFSYFLDSLSRGFYFEPEKMGPRFKVYVPDDDQEMPLAQFGRVRVKTTVHKKWTPPTDERSLEAHARALLAAAAYEDLFAFHALLPQDAPKPVLLNTSPAGKHGKKEDKNRTGKTEGNVKPEETAAFLNALPERLQPRGGAARTKIDDKEALVQIQAFPVNPINPGVTIFCRYRNTAAAGKTSWHLTAVEVRRKTAKQP